MQKKGRMICFDAGKVLDLMPAGETRGNDGCPSRRIANCREKFSFSDGLGNIVVLALIAKGAGHAAAAGVEIRDLGAGN